MFFIITAEIKIDSYDSLPLEKPLTLHNVVIQTKSFLNKDQNVCINWLKYVWNKISW